MKVFTKTHFDNLSQLIIEALFKDKTFYNNLNMPITVYDLVNNTTNVPAERYRGLRTGSGNLPP